MINELELIDVREGVHYNTSEDNNMSEKIINITSLRKDLYKISESVIADGEIYNITTKNGVLVMVSKEEYDALIETLYLSNNPEFKKSLIAGKNAKDEETVKEEDVSW